MTETHKPEFLRTVPEYFTKSTDADARAAWEAVKGYAWDDALDAMGRHRDELGANAWRPKIPRLRELAANFAKARRIERWKAERIVDGLRKLDPITYSPDVADYAVILGHYAGAWEHFKANADPENEIGARAVRVAIRSHCKAALREIGIDDAQAERDSSECVELQPGEKIARASDEIFHAVSAA